MIGLGGLALFARDLADTRRQGAGGADQSLTRHQRRHGVRRPNCGHDLRGSDADAGTADGVIVVALEAVGVRLEAGRWGVGPHVQVVIDAGGQHLVGNRIAIGTAEADSLC